jgi:ubiquinone/menaquinone biosynthesis C-methylase UbiE
MADAALCGTGYTYGGTAHEEAQRLAGQAVSFLEHDLPVLQRFGLTAGMRVLDLGCGSGAVTVALARAVAPGVVVGVDRDSGLLRHAAQLASASGMANVAFVQGDIQSLQLPEASFDFVFCRLVLWSIPACDTALGTMMRMAKSGGIVCADEPDAGSVLHWPPHPAHERYWTGRVRYHQERQGQDPLIGRKLYALFHQVQLQDVRVGVSCLPYTGTYRGLGDGKYVGPGAEAIDTGYIAERELQELAAWAEEPLAFTLAPLVIVAGRKVD